MVDLESHILYLAPTRPSMKWGVPAEGFVLNIGLLYALVPLLAAGNIYWLVGGWLLAVPNHYVMRALANRNPGFFREMRMWARTKAAVMGGTLWCMPVSERPDGEALPGA